MLMKGSIQRGNAKTVNTYTLTYTLTAEPRTTRNENRPSERVKEAFPQ